MHLTAAYSAQVVIDSSGLRTSIQRCWARSGLRVRATTSSRAPYCRLSFSSSMAT